MEAARVRVAEGGDPSAEECWGIQGPGITGRTEWLSDHALYSFRHLWKAETGRRGVEGPELIERYPYLAGGKPESLPGIDELRAECEGAAIVTTVDPFHHGIGYGDSPENALYPEQGGIELARQKIGEGIKFLERGDYWGYNQHCVEAKSDGRDAGQVFRFMGGSKQQERIWNSVLTRLAEHYGVTTQVETRKTLVDNRIQWSQAKNVWYNSELRSMVDLPIRMTRRVFKRGPSE
jgi:hypothetical protein